MKRLYFGPALLILVACCLWTKGQHPSGYDEIKARTHPAEFHFLGLERKVEYRFSTSFYAPEPVTQQFRILIRPDGTVKYVKPILQPGIDPEFRLGGAHALYKYRFATVLEDTGDVWVDVEMTVGKK